MSSNNEPHDLAATPSATRPRRWRGVMYAGVLVFGGVATAVLVWPGAGFGQGWRDGGPGAMMHGFAGPMHGGMGDGMGLPGPMRWHVEGMLDEAGVSAEQRGKLKPIFDRAADQIFDLRAKHLEGRRQIRDVLAAPTIDRTKLDSLRQQQLQLADSASKAIMTALADAAEVLTPEQRAEIARRIERRERWFRG
jgi:Spy/CpxP family protein refolding chaperone